jgi:hypothetical protein
MRNLVSRLGSQFRGWKIPQDGARRYLYDIWQPLTLLVITTSFMAAFFKNYSPYSSAVPTYDWFFCNADGTLEKTNIDYRPLWDPHLYFTINIAFGSFYFSTAKIIDAAWDAIVGRGGQILAAVVAYRTLRRSLTLTMESCTIPIPAVTSLYCQQIQLIPVGRLINTMFWQWGSVNPIWRQPFLRGRARCGIQIFVCTYVLLFATLASVMTGYTAQLTGFFGSGASQTGQLFPINQLVEPRLALYDGVRAGLPDTIMYAHDTIRYPEGIFDYYDSERKPGTSSYSITELLNISRDLKHPSDVLLDC